MEIIWEKRRHEPAMRSDKKVIILDDIRSDCIEQAMFILKDSRPENIDAVSEAERIIENYQRRCRYTLYPRTKGPRGKSLLLTAVLGITVGAAAFFTVLFLLGQI